MKRRLSPILYVLAVINFILFIIKFFIGVRTNCISIYTDSVNNLMDTLSTLGAAIGVHFLNYPKTEKHPNGFGRVEYVIGFLMAIIMTTAGLLFAYNSVGRFFNAAPVWFLLRYAVIVGATCFVKLAMGIVLAIKQKKTPSPVIKTVMLDSFLDCGITFAAVLSFTLTNVTGFLVDAFFGLAISTVITISGVKLVVSSFSTLIGEFDGETDEQIRKIIKETDENAEIVRINTHNYGVGRGVADIYLKRCDATVKNTIKQRLSEELNLDSAVEMEETL